MNNIDSQGVNTIDADPNFNFLSNFTAEADDESIHSNCTLNMSPYNELNIECSYVDVEQLPNLVKKDDFSVVSLNIQSLPAKFNELLDWTANMEKIGCSPDIICLQEVWQINDPSLFNITGYQPLISKSRTNFRGGGVGIYIKENITFHLIDVQSIFHERVLETILVEITLHGGKKIVIGSIYRPGTLPPGTTFTHQFNEFNDLYSNLLAELCDKYESVYLYGDLNLDILRHSESKFVTEYLETLISNGFIQLVLKPTRITNNSATLIDHISTNACTDKFRTYILCNSISDHFPILHVSTLKKSKIKAPPIAVRNYSDVNLASFRTALLDYSWQHVLDIDDAQSAFDTFSDSFQQIFDLYFPLKTKKTILNTTKLNLG